MPGIDELNWRDYEDFTGGLWERHNDRQCVPNGLLECTDCYPLPSGGLKAFIRFHPVRAAYESSSADILKGNVLGVFVGGENYWHMTIGGTGSPFTWSLWRLKIHPPNASVDPAYPAEDDLDGRGTWEQYATLATVANFGTAIRATPYRAIADLFAFNMPIVNTTASGSSDQGIWQFDAPAKFLPTTAGLSSQFARPHGVWVYQDRLIFAGNIAGALTANTPLSIRYTDAGSTAASTANYLNPYGATPEALQWVHPFPPSELYVFKKESGLLSIQGPITAPTIRQLTPPLPSARGFPVHTPLGLVMVLQNQGAVAWDGQALVPLSQAIEGDPMGGTTWSQENYFHEGGMSIFNATPTALQADLIGAATWGQRSVNRELHHLTGQPAYYENWIFFNNGYVMDITTGGWLKQTSAPGARYWAVDYIGRRLFVSTNGPLQVDGGTLSPLKPVMYWSRMGEGDWDPMPEYSFTVPLIESPGQKTNLREVEYYLTTYNARSTLTVEVTHSSSTEPEVFGPYELADDRPDVVRVVIPGHPENWYKVRTILKSNRADQEAPTLSKMRVGTQEATRTAVNR